MRSKGFHSTSDVHVAGLCGMMLLENTGLCRLTHLDFGDILRFFSSSVRFGWTQLVDGGRQVSPGIKVGLLVLLHHLSSGFGALKIRDQVFMDHFGPSRSTPARSPDLRDSTDQTQLKRVELLFFIHGEKHILSIRLTFCLSQQTQTVYFLFLFFVVFTL